MKIKKKTKKRDGWFFRNILTIWFIIIVIVLLMFIIDGFFDLNSEKHFCATKGVDLYTDNQCVKLENGHLIAKSPKFECSDYRRMFTFRTCWFVER